MVRFPGNECIRPIVLSFLSWLADRLILVPSRDPIDPDGKERRSIRSPAGTIETWVGCFPEEITEFNLVIVKFPGTAGRAERAGVHPAEIWQDRRSEIWAVNPNGYGGSQGRASVTSIPGMVESVISHVAGARPGVRILVVGNSLGCLAALYAAANFEVAGVLLRNPPPLHQLICERPRYAAWNFGLSSFIAAEVPAELDAIANAARCEMPCLFVQSERDTVVPVGFQDCVIGQYSGTKKVFVIEGAEHHELVGEAQQDAYLDAVKWLAAEVFESGN